MPNANANANAGSPSLPSRPCHLFVDEAGTPEIFDRKGRDIVGVGGCSRFFMLGVLEVESPRTLAESLHALRTQLLGDPYFAGVPSFQPERKKTALLFHAKDDLPEVRLKVFELLRAAGNRLCFRAVVCDKQVIRAREQGRREMDARYRYAPDALYDELVRALFGKFNRTAGTFHLHIAKRGNRGRNAAIRTALEAAENDFVLDFGFSRGGIECWQATITNPQESVCLQAADYFLWALQRFYEPRLNAATGASLREARYLSAMLPQIAQIYDMHTGPTQGTFFSPGNPLTLEGRFGARSAG
jgi:hypothetical protein